MAKKSLKERASKLKLKIQYKEGNEFFQGSDGNTYSKKEGNALLMEGKATVHTWHGKKSRPDYEGTQYRGGRKEGRKNLKKLADGTLQNTHGVIFTQEDKKRLENEVNKANYQRKKMLKEEASLPRTVNGKPTGQTVGQLQLMGHESDFIISRKSKSMQRFKTREQFEEYIDQLKYINSGEYVDDRIELYKENHIKALENVFGHMSDDVVEHIKNMDNKTYMKMVQRDEMLEVQYIYDPSAMAGKLNQIRRSFGLIEREEELE